MSRARRAFVRIRYNNTDITEDIGDDLKEFSYTDAASGESDSISLTLKDREKKWMGGWMPEKGSNISADIIFKDWAHEGDDWEMYCGEFEVDDVSLSGPPAVCKIKAVSIPRSEAFNEKERTKNWQNITVKEIAEEIAGRAGIELFYDAEEISIRVLEQDKQTDCKFLYAVCKKYGLAMKVFANKIVIFDEAAYEAADTMIPLYYDDFTKFSYNSTLAGTYTGAKLAYMDPAESEIHTVEVGDGSRIMEMNEEADNAKDAERKAIAALNNANKKDATFSGTVMPKRGIIASSCINIEGFGKLDGIYYIDEVVTKISRNSASKQSISAHRTGNRMDDATVIIDAKPEIKDTGEDTSYTVVKGDTLWSIAESLLGSPLRYAEIYNKNRDVIEAEAQNRGKKDSSNGHWIFPGTELIIPGKD